MAHGEWRKVGASSVVLCALAITLLGAAVGCWVGYRRDCNQLRTVAEKITADARSGSERVLALLHWVHVETGTAKNHSYFVLPTLGATPIQVLHAGGDCADKSRLLSAMLREVGVPATMAMCFHPATGQPSHTIVEARTDPDAFMVVDPAFDLYFPRPDGSGYFGLLDLRREPAILLRRLDQLCDTAPRTHPIHSYNRTQAVYDRAGSINWNRNWLMGFVRDRLLSGLGDDVYRLSRPVPFEEPKLFVAAVALLSGLSASSLWGFRVWQARRHHARPQPRAHSRRCIPPRRLVRTTPAGRANLLASRGNGWQSGERKDDLCGTPTPAISPRGCK
ncbi:MAG: transglutaminase domain-containing protein [Planctomycetes bacterium]|nr:transglutaminase domain-containing protein [Planctomycetota bacterium]